MITFLTNRKADIIFSWSNLGVTLTSFKPITWVEYADEQKGALKGDVQNTFEGGPELSEWRSCRGFLIDEKHITAYY